MFKSNLNPASKEYLIQYRTAYGMLVTNLRLQKRLSIDELAEVCDVSISTIEGIEAFDVDVPKRLFDRVISSLGAY